MTSESAIAGLTSNRGEEDAEDLRLLQGVALGDEIAFNKLYARLNAHVIEKLNKLMRRKDMVEEVSNDVWFRVWKYAASFKGGCKVSTWIMGIAIRVKDTAFEKLQRTPEREARDLSEVEVDEDLEPLSLVSILELEAWLPSALSKLTPDQRIVFSFIYFFGRTYGEVADIIGCDLNTAKSRMFRAREKLRAQGDFV